MSKFIAVKFRNTATSEQIGKIKRVFTSLGVEGISNEFSFLKSDLCKDFFLCVLNPLEPLGDSGYVSFGHQLTKGAPQNTQLPDGSYFGLEYSDQKITFFCDRFESKTIWYYLDDEKLIISNSQRALVGLKRKFTLNRSAVAWFLSAGSLGANNSWDSEIQKVRHSQKYIFDIAKWMLDHVPTSYVTLDEDFESLDVFDDKFLRLTRLGLKQSIGNCDISSVLLPLSGGNDSRLLYSLMLDDEALSSIKTINWGVDKPKSFNDKTAARKIAHKMGSRFIDVPLPTRLTDIDDFLNCYIRYSDCRIDHFNAFADNFAAFKSVFKESYKLIIRGDIPFTEGIDLDEKMARAHIGIPQFSDFSNYTDYDLREWTEIQLAEFPDVSRRDGESLIEWRDRLYIDYRIPIVISAFNDISNGFVESRNPMMSFSHFKLYNRLANNQKGDKRHIVRLSKRLDKSGVSFNASPAIPSINELFYTRENIGYLTSRLENMSSSIFSESLRQQIVGKLSKVRLDAAPTFSILSLLKRGAKTFLPARIKAQLKSTANNELNPITLAYRIVLIDKAIVTYSSRFE